MKLFYRSLIVLTIAFFSFNQSATASHISGGDITYKCVGQDSFLVTLSIFRDCAGIGLGNTQTVNFDSPCGPSVTASLAQVSFGEISQLCPLQIPNSTCNGGAWPGMEGYVYEGIVVLAPACNSWLMYWSSCCRNNQISNGPANEGTYLYNRMFSGVDSCNTSPTFTSLPIPYVCKNQLVNYNFGVIEPDGDSIVYSLSPGYTNGLGATVTYDPPYTYLQPLPGANAVLNPTNGQLTFTPTVQGVFVIVVVIEEYSRLTGVAKGTSIRDIQVVVQNCSNIQPKVVSPGMYNFSGSATQIDSNTISMCIGERFSFDYSISDANASQTVTMFHNIFKALDNSAVVTVTNGNPAVIHVEWTAPGGSPPFTSFSLTGIDDACPVVGLVSGAINVNINKSTYAGTDTSLCAGTQWVDLNVVGGPPFLWTVLTGSGIDTIAVSPNYNMTCFNCPNPSVSPQTTTVYLVQSQSVLPGGCKMIDTIEVKVNPNFDLVMPNDTTICPIDSINLPVIETVSGTYTYQWTDGRYMDDDAISNPKVLPLAPNLFTVKVTSLGGCIKKGQVFVDLTRSFPPNISIFGDTVICFGDSTQLDVILGDVPQPYCGVSTLVCVGNTHVGTIGSGTSTNTPFSYPAPYGNYQSGARHQLLYTASELHDMGLTAGKISAISFNVTTPGTTSSFSNFEIKMGCTSSSNLSAAWETGLVIVKSAYTHSRSSGWNKHTFDVEYDWNGSDNLVIEMCFSNSSSSSGGSSFTPFTVTPFSSVRWYANANACTSPNAGVTSSERPNIRFDFCSGANTKGFDYLWTPTATIDTATIYNPLVFPLTTTTYQVVVSDTSGTCSDTVTKTVAVTNQFDARFSFPDTICINEGVTTAMPNVGKGVFTGKGIVDSILGNFDPDTAGIGPTTITYTVSTLTGGCLNDSTRNVEVISLPNAVFTPKEFCENSVSDTLFGLIRGGTWSGQGIVDPINGIFDPVGLSAGNYLVVYTLTDPCTSTDTQFVRVIKPYTFVFNDTTVNVCLNSQLNVANNYTLSSNPLQGSGPVKGVWSDANGYISTAGVFDATGVAPGKYSITLSITGMDGSCGTSQNMEVVVRGVEYASTVQEMTFCSSEKNAKLYVSPYLFGAGINFTQTPIAPLGANDTLTIISFGQNARFDATKMGVGEWQLDVYKTTSFGCVGVHTDTIRVLKTPAIPVYDEASYCEGDDVNLFASSVTNPDSVYWYSDKKLKKLIGVGNPVYWGIAPNPEDTTTIYVYLTQNNYKCNSKKLEFQLPFHPTPKAKFTMSYTDTSNTAVVGDTSGSLIPIYGFSPLLVNFDALSTNNGDTITWFHHYEKSPDQVGDEINRTNNAKVSFRYTVPNIESDGTVHDAFINQLVVTNKWGCSDTSSALIYDIATEAFFNVFTPNGDGQNDVFYLPLFGLKDYKVLIYNRWGKEVYTWEDPSEGWAGQDQPDGVYYYVISGVNVDGSDYKKQGTVTLMGSVK